jgi:hypothetical protein
VLVVLGLPGEVAGPVLLRAYANAGQALLAAVLVLAWSRRSPRPWRPDRSARERSAGGCRGSCWWASRPATAVLGLFGRPPRATPGLLGPARPGPGRRRLGAVGGRLLLLTVARAARWFGSGRPRSRRRAVGWLALRRLAAPAEARLLVLTLLTTALAMQLYAVTAAAAVDDVTVDRAVGARRRAGHRPGRGLLAAGRRPGRPAGARAGVRPVRAAGHPAGQHPQLPEGEALVWRDRAQVVGVFGDVRVMVIDPESFRAAASWGQGPELGRARDVLPALAAADARTAERLGAGQLAELLVAGRRPPPVPVLVVGRTQLAAGQQASIDLALEIVSVDVVGVLPAFPGAEQGRTTVVMTAGAFPLLLDKDPRFRQPPRTTLTQSFRLEVWSVDGSRGLDRLLAPRGIVADDVATLEQASQRPELVAARRSLGYQLALAASVAVVAVLGLCLYADRAAARGRPADLLLRRAGLGRTGPLWARIVELALTGTAGLLLAVAAVLLVTPLAAELVDGANDDVPALVFAPTPAALLLTVASAALAVLAAALVTVLRGRSGSDGQVLRDAE